MTATAEKHQTLFDRQMGVLRQVSSMIMRPARMPRVEYDGDDDREHARAWERAVRRMRSDNRGRAIIDTVAFMNMTRDMDTTAGQGGDWVKSGINGEIVLPLMKVTDIGRLGTVTESVDKLSDAIISRVNTPPAVAFLDEDESLPETDVLTTSAADLETSTAGCANVLSRKLVKQVKEDLVAGIATLQNQATGQASQAALMAGTTAAKQPVGLETRSAHTTTASQLTMSVTATVTRTLSDAGADIKNMGVMVGSAVLETLLSQPIDSGSGIMQAGRDDDSPTGYSLYGGSTRGGIALGHEPSMSAGVAIFGDYTKARILVNGTTDLIVVNSVAAYGAEGRVAVFSFTDLDVSIDRPDAFFKVDGIQ